MKRFGVVSYNIHSNFTNYGSALQSYALNKAIAKLGYYPVLVDYCPDCLKDKDALNPFKNMWDSDPDSIASCELSMPAIKDNYWKFDRFYNERFNRSRPYTRENFSEIMGEVDHFVCGSDTIFSPDEFGLDDGYLANYPCMRQNSISYAASFGDPHFSEKQYVELDRKLKNFRALGIREELMINYIKEKVNVPVQRVIDPTLLLEAGEYEDILADKRPINDEYLLYYSRRYNPIMEAYVGRVSRERNLKVVEISLRAKNADKGHIMLYSAGVEEFLSLVKYASFVVTNSYHGMIFSIQFKKDFVVFSRALCDSKINELLDTVGIYDRVLKSGTESFRPIDYDDVFRKISAFRERSMSFLETSLKALEDKNGIFKQ